MPYKTWKPEASVTKSTFQGKTGKSKVTKNEKNCRDELHENLYFSFLQVQPKLMGTGEETVRRNSIYLFDQAHGLPAYSHHGKIPPWWGNVSNDEGGNVSVSKTLHTPYAMMNYILEYNVYQETHI